MKSLRALRRYPSAIAGLVLIGIVVLIAVHTLITLPYSEATMLWRGGQGVWEDSPRNALPVYFDLFTQDKLPRTIIVRSEESGTTHIEPSEGDNVLVEVVLPFEYRYDGFPSELILAIEGTWEAARHPISVYWRKPNGEVITLRENLLVTKQNRYYISQDMTVRSALGGAPHRGLFARDHTLLASGWEPLHGDYELVVRTEFREGDELQARLVVYGQIHGLAGTDHMRRDLMVALRWGAVVGLMFGVLAAVGAQLSTFVLAGIATWFGGTLEAIFHRITHVNMILPMLPILIMFGYFYSRSIWVMLGLVIALNVFSGAMLTYRAIFLQLKEAPYIEAGLAYGAGNLRIVFRYLLPRMAPMLLPQFVLVVPGFVFLEATLAVLGLGDPILPTWGKVINDGFTQGALYKGHYYWILQPSVLLMVMGFGFALVGYALDRVFNPKLRTV